MSSLERYGRAVAAPVGAAEILRLPRR